MTLEALKWDFSKREYEPYELLDDWTIFLYCDDMDMPVNCACCGKELDFGSTYTSRKIHTRHGFGFPVCPECHEKELAEESEMK